MEAAAASLGHAVETAPAALTPALTLADLFEADKLYEHHERYRGVYLPGEYTPFFYEELTQG